MASNVDDLADRFDISGPTHIVSRSGVRRSSAMVIDWYVICDPSIIIHAILDKVRVN